MRRPFPSVWRRRNRRVERYKYFETLIDIVEARVLKEGLAKSGDTIAITSETPVGEGSTIDLKIHTLP